MKKSELNKKIALYFGFKKVRKKFCNVNQGITTVVNPKIWEYPDKDDWCLPQGGANNYDLPDFITILEDYLKLMKKHGAFGPRDYNVDPNG